MGTTRSEARRAGRGKPEVDHVSPELEALLDTFTDEEVATGVIWPRMTLDGLQAELEGMDRSRGADWLMERVSGIPGSDLDKVMLGLRPIPEFASARVVVARVAVLLGVTRGQAARVLGVSPARVRRNDMMSLAMLDRALALCRQWFPVHRVLGAENAGSWFLEGNPGLDMARPVDLLATGYGQRRVDNLIESLLYGNVV